MRGLLRLLRVEDRGLVQGEPRACTPPICPDPAGGSAVCTGFLSGRGTLRHQADSRSYQHSACLRPRALRSLKGTECPPKHKAGGSDATPLSREACWLRPSVL